VHINKLHVSTDCEVQFRACDCPVPAGCQWLAAASLPATTAIQSLSSPSPDFFFGGGGSVVFCHPFPSLTFPSLLLLLPLSSPCLEVAPQIQRKDLGSAAQLAPLSGENNICNQQTRSLRFKHVRKMCLRLGLFGVFRAQERVWWLQVASCFC